jgi:hypothetical protein
MPTDSTSWFSFYFLSYFVETLQISILTNLNFDVEKLFTKDTYDLYFTQVNSEMSDLILLTCLQRLSWMIVLFLKFSFYLIRHFCCLFLLYKILEVGDSQDSVLLFPLYPLSLSYLILNTITAMHLSTISTSIIYLHHYLRYCSSL